MSVMAREGIVCQKHGLFWRLANTNQQCFKCVAELKERKNVEQIIGEIRPDIDDLLNSDGVLLRSNPNVP